MTFTYDDSPSRLDTLVSADEAKLVARTDPSWVVKDLPGLAHYLARVERTIVAYRSQILDLHHDVQSTQMSRSQAGASPTLSPMEAVRYLTPEQFGQVADAATRARLDSAANVEAQAQDLRTLAQSRISEAKLVLSTLLDDPHLNDAARERISAALERFSNSSAALTPLEGIFDD